MIAMLVDSWVSYAKLHHIIDNASLLSFTHINIRVGFRQVV